MPPVKKEDAIYVVRNVSPRRAPIVLQNKSNGDERIQQFDEKAGLYDDFKKNKKKGLTPILIVTTIPHTFKRQTNGAPEQPT